MSKKRNHKPEPQKPQAPVKKSVSATTWITGAVVLIAVIAVIALGSGRGGGTPDGATPGVSSGAVSADEAKYLGRLLPAAYAEPSVAAAASYTSALKMANVEAVQDAKQTTLSVADVTASKIVYFEYKKTGADPVPMVAYVKPSGKLFVGVSFCIPCKGTGQSIDADGTLRCDSCGTKRDLETGAGISGACKLYPLDELPVTVKDGVIVLQNSDIDAWTPQPLDRPVGA